MAKKKQPAAHLSAGRGPVVALVVAGAVIAAVWLLFTGPARSEASKSHEQLTQTTRALSTSQARLADLRSGKQRSADQLLTKSRELDGLLPQALDRVRVVSDLDRVAQASGVTLDTMTPQEANVSGDVTEQQYAAAVSGSLAQISRFITSVTKQNPLTTISGFSFSGSDTKSTATFTLSTWSVNKPATGALG